MNDLSLTNMERAQADSPPSPMAGIAVDDALLRWRLVLGPERAGGAAGAGQLLAAADATVESDQRLANVDRALDFLYGPDGGPRGAGLEASMPYVPTWLGDIRRYFPREVVAFME